MQNIPLSLAQPGMKLAKAITKANGMPIVGVGVELTEALIDRLDSMGIDTVSIAGAAVSASQNPSERVLRLDHLFRRLEGDPDMVKVKAYLREYFSIRAAADAAKQAKG